MAIFHSMLALVRSPFRHLQGTIAKSVVVCMFAALVVLIITWPVTRIRPGREFRTEERSVLDLVLVNREFGAVRQSVGKNSVRDAFEWRFAGPDYWSHLPVCVDSSGPQLPSATCEEKLVRRLKDIYRHRETVLFPLVMSNGDDVAVLLLPCKEDEFHVIISTDSKEESADGEEIRKRLLRSIDHVKFARVYDSVMGYRIVEPHMIAAMLNRRKVRAVGSDTVTGVWVNKKR